jgi:hypothetical protein
MNRIQASKVGIEKEPHVIKSNIMECVEQGRYCQGKFIATREGQTDTCMKCMEMLDGEMPKRIEIEGGYKMKWS